MMQDQASVDVHDDEELLVAGRRRRQLTSGQKVAVAALVAVVFLAFIWIDYSLQLKTAPKQSEVDFRPKLGTYRAVPLELPDAPEPRTADPAPTTKTGAGQGGVTSADSPLMAFGANDVEPAEAVRPAADAPSSPSSDGAAAAARILSGINATVPPIAVDGSDDSTSIGARLKPTSLDASRAAALPHPDMLITKGTIIPCTLLTAISTDLPGFVRCVLPEAVRGTTGRVVLLDRGTMVVGEIQKGLAQGQRRAFVLWDRAETPDHAVVSLASPSADELGRAGVPGQVNNHFWQRFGGAVLLTMVQGSFQAVSAAAGRSGGGNNVYLNPFQANGQQAADTALRSGINIPPTLQKKQGEAISIMVARDLDFSDIYVVR